MSKTYVVISDTQMPYEDKPAVAAVLRFIGDYQPDEVVQIGDLVDFPQPSRWSKDSAAEFQGSVFEDAEYTKVRFLEPLRAVYDGPVCILEGNHDERPRKYLSKYAPALAASKAFDMDQMLDFDGFGVKLLPDFYEFAPEWVMTHGHKGGIRINQEAGRTALNAAIRFHSSVIMGHTHRLAALPKSVGYDARVKTLWGVEVGNLMDMKQAVYANGATFNWQQGFAIVRVDGTDVNVQTIPIVGRKFVVDGETYTI